MRVLLLSSLFSLTLGGLVFIGSGCSSIPDVVYDDQIDGGGGRDASSGSSSSGSGGPFNCTNNKPPSNKGVCCGTRLCLKCSPLQCDRCGKENCNNNDEFCCAVNPGGGGSSIDCRKQTSCD